jgi:aminoglycoside phosphotransferase (APT) family kinase protein
MGIGMIDEFDSAARARLSEWLKNVAPQVRDLRTIEKFAGGQSNPTYRIDGTNGSAVLRRRPFGVLLPKAHMIEREYKVMSAIQGSGVPVPAMFAYCNDESILGAAFYLMEHVESRIFWDPPFPQAYPIGISTSHSVYFASHRFSKELPSVPRKAMQAQKTLPISGPVPPRWPTLGGRSRRRRYERRNSSAANRTAH